MLRRKPELASPDCIEKEIKATEQLGGQFIFWDHENYPFEKKLDPYLPPVLVVCGDTNLLLKPRVAIVGARNASFHGNRLAFTMAKELGQSGLTVVSGFARGIDAAAHKGSIDTGTIAVLGTGLGRIYPDIHKTLFSEIREKGLLISHFSYDTGPQVQNFPVRNRLIAALVEGVVVIEAAFQSGSLTTAEQAGEYGKEVFSVPGSPLDPRCRGSNKLIREGATLVESALDVLEGLNPQLWHAHRQKNQRTQKTHVQKGSLDVSKVLEQLSAVPVSVDDLAEKLEMPIHHLSSILTKLEIDEKVEAHQGNRVSLVLQGQF
ncbi:MAG: DNA-protecting protein DprA [Holosporaceae bacterium]|nr:MAG: DNA-protecting protein DprA [Holosporaceae bacterium]